MAVTVSSGGSASSSSSATSPTHAPVASGATVTPPRPAAPVSRPSVAPVGITREFTKEMRGELQDLRRIPAANMDRKMRERLAELEAAEKPYLEARAKAVQ